ncbi:hypothetical protein KUV51_02850 [Tateyamaria omphalii]|uniref:hypothetical protein n=1 Tax=Tateyamaria omphalii TaxID=299262 RepID=UPI001C99395D|nr:hypothetical protein [Tateyamaria omphalii]MBY5931928.1 hypothetical protein [Tateyamaria omphalii]
MKTVATTSGPKGLAKSLNTIAIDMLDAGDRLHFDQQIDLALLVTGKVRLDRDNGPTMILSGPSVLLRSEMENTSVRVLQELHLLQLSYEGCAALVARNKVYRDLLFSAMTGRIRLFQNCQASLMHLRSVGAH